MFCLRSWLPLLFIPTNASPLFIVSFVTLTYILHRPCIYCSALLLILFISSCHWSDRCFFDLRGDWFAPRYFSDPSASSVAPNETVAGYILETVNTTTKTLAGVVVDEAQRRLALNGSSAAAGLGGLVQEEWTGVGLEWLRSLLGRREWTIPCVDVKIVYTAPYKTKSFEPASSQ
ncbi:bladder cancer-related protein BC10-domain-containing protein [Aspergillus transmontanensis]|uniref:Bladder cancer-related protein BC10-domain-containing protein n=1 Tax=Aspergillus transmontanensis TaxID=1034304 RepID=A0A5N6VKE6_9EURO|nr:bladder cancer-related protein BC10-domain-containing protein [Aspergillus transmontanensis]